MAIKDGFTNTANPAASWRREGLPPAKDLARLGIRTKESLDWLAAQDPKTPALEHHTPDAALREEAASASQQEHRARIMALRKGFKARSAKARADFGTAHIPREPERDRDR